MKNKLLNVLIVLLILVSGWTIFYSQNTVNAARKDLNQERFIRLTVEEKLDKANASINFLKAELNGMQGKIKSTQILLDKTLSINNDLKSRLDKAAEINEKLEKKIKELGQMSSIKKAVDSLGAA